MPKKMDSRRTPPQPQPMRARLAHLIWAGWAGRAVGVVLLPHARGLLLSLAGSCLPAHMRRTALPLPRLGCWLCVHTAHAPHTPRTPKVHRGYLEWEWARETTAGLQCSWCAAVTPAALSCQECPCIDPLQQGSGTRATRLGPSPVGLLVLQKSQCGVHGGLGPAGSSGAHRPPLLPGLLSRVGVRHAFLSVQSVAA